MKYVERYTIILFLMIIPLFISCDNQGRMADKIMFNAEKIVETYPDSVLTLLDSIAKPLALNDVRYHRYILLMLQAKDKSYRDITGDTAIFATKHYYTEKNDLPHAAMAAYYCGRVRFEQKDDKGAMTQYVEAEKYATDISNINLKGLIQSAMGAALSRQMLTNEALLRFQQAAKYFQQVDNRKNEIISYQLIGNSYLAKLRTDSALHYYNKSLQIASVLKDSVNILAIKQNIGILYKEVEGDFASAKKYFLEAVHDCAGNDYSRLCLKLADIYSAEKNRDSTKWYISQSLSHLQDNKKDVYLVADVYNTLATIKEREGSYAESSKYYKKYADCQDSIFRETRDATLLDIAKKYKLEQLKSDNIALALEKQKLLFYSAIGAFFSLFVILLFYRRNSLIKKRELEAEQKIFHLMNMAKNYDEKEATVRNILLRQFDIVRKTATLKNYIHKGDENSNKLLKKFNEIVYGKEGLNWVILYDAMNELYNGLFDNLRNEYPNLGEDEFRICCLTYADFTREEISIIMELSISTVQSKRNFIRKKLGIPSTGDIKSFLDQKKSF
jgi:hypothetical protein